MNGPPPTLEFLAFGWGDAYLLSHARGRSVALRRDRRYFLAGPTLEGLEKAIISDYGRHPVPRDFVRLAPRTT